MTYIQRVCKSERNILLRSIKNVCKCKERCCPQPTPPHQRLHRDKNLSFVSAVFGPQAKTSTSKKNQQPTQQQQQQKQLQPPPPPPPQQQQQQCYICFSCFQVTGDLRPLFDYILVKSKVGSWQLVERDGCDGWGGENNAYFQTPPDRIPAEEAKSSDRQRVNL